MFNFYRKSGLGRIFRTRTYNKLQYNLVSFETAKNMIENSEVVLIDVRSKNEYNSLHIKNAINIPVDEVEMSVANFDKDCKIMIYCASGTRSKSAISTLNKMGYFNIYIWEYAALTTFPYKNMLIYNKN